MQKREKEFVEEIEYPKYTLSLTYELANKIEHYIKNYTILLDTKYDENITFEFALDNDSKIETIIVAAMIFYLFPVTCLDCQRVMF